jgi:hypothetical protein
VLGRKISPFLKGVAAFLSFAAGGFAFSFAFSFSFAFPTSWSSEATHPPLSPQKKGGEAL